MFGAFGNEQGEQHGWDRVQCHRSSHMDVLKRQSDPACPQLQPSSAFTLLAIPVSLRALRSHLQPGSSHRQACPLAVPSPWNNCPVTPQNGISDCPSKEACPQVLSAIASPSLRPSQLPLLALIPCCACLSARLASSLCSHREHPEGRDLLHFVPHRVPCAWNSAWHIVGPH